MATLLSLPNELLLDIASYLKTVDITHLKNSSRTLNNCLDQYVYISCKNRARNWPIINWGIRFDHAFMVEKALQYGLDPNTVTAQYRDPDCSFTLAEYAVAWESPASLKVLLENGATPPPIPLMMSKYWACFYGEGSLGFLMSDREPAPVTPGFNKLAACFRLLVKHGAALNTGRPAGSDVLPPYLQTCLVDMVLLGSGGLNVIHSLVKAGMRWEAFETPDDAPLAYAVNRYERTFKTFDHWKSIATTYWASSGCC